MIDSGFVIVVTLAEFPCVLEEPRYARAAFLRQLQKSQRFLS